MYYYADNNWQWYWEPKQIFGTYIRVDNIGGKIIFDLQKKDFDGTDEKTKHKGRLGRPLFLSKFYNCMKSI